MVNTTEVSYNQLNEGMEVSNRVKVALDEIFKLVGQMAAMMDIVSEVSQKQSDLIKSIIKDIGELSLISQGNASAYEQTSSSMEEQTASMQEIASTSRELSRDVLELKDLLARFKV